MNPKKTVKGIILAGGYGTRLYPLTIGISKQLLPVYDKPMIYYPLFILMQAMIRDILIISTKEELPRFKKLFGNGSKLGLRIQYKYQDEPNGIAEAFIIGDKFISTDNVVLILGDNIFFGKHFNTKLKEAKKNLESGISSIFTKEVENPNEFGVIKFDDNNQIEKIIEKPKINISKNVVCGIYFFTNEVLEISRELKPSERGELEITDINNYFLKSQKLNAVLLDDDIIWSDVGTYESLLKISRYFYKYEKEFNKKVACIEELALSLGYISDNEFISLANKMINSDYGKYLLNKIKD